MLRVLSTKCKLKWMNLFLYSETDPVTGKKKVIFTPDPEDTDGTRKYTLGYFSDKQEAETFKEYLRLLRVRDAIVVAYQ